MISFTKMFFSIVLSAMVVMAQQPHTHSPKINSDELRCLVCEKSIEELINAVNKLDPNKSIDVGGYRLDDSGNYLKKTVSQAKSEIHLSEMIEEVCEKMDDYARATWKTNGKLTLFKMIDDNGQMNSDMNKVDMIVDDDLNKSLQYYCQEIMNEYEDDIIPHIQNNEDVKWKICHEKSHLCASIKHETDEL